MKTVKDIKDSKIGKITHKDLNMIQSILQSIIIAAENGDDYIYINPTDVNSVVKELLIDDGYQVQPLNSLGDLCEKEKDQPVCTYKISW